MASPFPRDGRVRSSMGACVVFTLPIMKSVFTLYVFWVCFCFCVCVGVDGGSCNDEVELQKI